MDPLYEEKAGTAGGGSGVNLRGQTLASSKDGRYTRQFFQLWAVFLTHNEDVSFTYSRSFTSMKLDK